jgi:hypothetical protein
MGIGTSACIGSPIGRRDRKRSRSAS